MWTKKRKATERRKQVTQIREAIRNVQWSRRPYCS